VTAGLRDVDRFTIPRRLMHTTQDALQEYGLEHRERFVLLTGTRTARAQAILQTAWVPFQLSDSHDSGLLVTVPGEELARLNIEWSRRNEQLMIQVHSHPYDPFHSPTDDRYAMVTTDGGLSIVVPHFGFVPLADLSACAVFRLEAGTWRWIKPSETAGLVHVR
jgi:hypothetical protein